MSSGEVLIREAWPTSVSQESAIAVLLTPWPRARRDSSSEASSDLRAESDRCGQSKQGRMRRAGTRAG